MIQSMMTWSCKDSYTRMAGFNRGWCADAVCKWIPSDRVCKKYRQLLESTRGQSPQQFSKKLLQKKNIIPLRLKVNHGQNLFQGGQFVEINAKSTILKCINNEFVRIVGYNVEVVWKREGPHCWFTHNCKRSAQLS